MSMLVGRVIRFPSFISSQTKLDKQTIYSFTLLAKNVVSPCKNVISVIGLIYNKIKIPV